MIPSSSRSLIAEYTSIESTSVVPDTDTSLDPN